MSKKIAISKVILEVGGKTFELSLNEAQELKQILIDTFPEKEVTYIPSSPIYIERWREPYWDRYKTWYGTTTKGAISLSSNSSKTNYQS